MEATTGIDDTLPDEEDFGPLDEVEIRTPFDPKEYIKRLSRKTICVYDTETDPFAKDRIVEPFSCGFSHPDFYVDFWGEDCIQQFIDWLYEYRARHPQEDLMVFCHNLGGFDYRFLAPHTDEGTTPSIINGRIAQVFIAGTEFRDSYRILPVALKVMQKDEFDYTKMEREVREKNKAEILLYQRHDCEYLREYIIGFFDMFGDRPTIGNTAMNYLRHFHGFEKLRMSQDTALRDFFMGGRCQNFVSGAFLGNWKVYDVNSMYPYAMKEFRHPLSALPIIGRTLQEKTAFVIWEGKNEGAVPLRGAMGELNFTHGSGRFHSTIHEIEAALDTGSIKIDRIVKTIGFERWGKFDAFIDHFFDLRLIAKAEGDKMGDLFYKLVMNSAYGKFAQNPSKFETFKISMGMEGFPNEDDRKSEENPNGWWPKIVNGPIIYWAKPSNNRLSGYFNVGIGASITGAARATLLRGIARARRPAYADTDSIICEALDCDLDERRLGAWKLEAEGELFACAGKKLYALFSRREQPGSERVTFQGSDFWCVKKASKGAVLSASEILQVALGDTVRYVSDRPNFKLDGSVEFVARDIKRTG